VLPEGIERFPIAFIDEDAMEIRLPCDYQPIKCEERASSDQHARTDGPRVSKTVLMTVTVECRAAQTRDAPDMAELIARCNEGYKAWAPAGWNAPSGIAEREEIHLTQRLADPSVCTLVAMKGDQLIAFAMWVPSRRTPGLADLSLLFVDPASWGIGLGRQLLLETEQSMLKASFSQAELWVPLANARARRLYERNGWRETNESRDHPLLGFELRRYQLSLTRNDAISEAPLT
jgi:GNAT superfamily N-acetyltransferase